MSDWFAPKRFGIGAGVPVSWQGWAVSLLFGAMLIGAALLLHGRPGLLLAVAISAVIIVSILCARHTRGGWRWRWGNRD